MDYYETLAAKIDLASRLRCDSLVPAGFDHNCFLSGGPEDPVSESPFSQNLGSCVGDCVYTDHCGDPTPHECEALLEGSGSNDEAGGESGTGDTGGAADTGGSDTGGVWQPGDIDCSGNNCFVDRAFAASIWDDPSVLLSEQTRLVFDSSESRFTLQGVETGSLAAELGLRNGDVLESVNGRTIDDLDAALEVYADSGEADAIRVQTERGTQWVDFTYTFVD